jgi:transcriptional regulator with XRE-family HTH domain
MTLRLVALALLFTRTVECLKGDVQMNNIVADVRKKLNLTQDEMAARIECSKMTVRRCEEEARLPLSLPVVKRLKRLCKEAGVEDESIIAAEQAQAAAKALSASRRKQTLMFKQTA